ncbi:MAG: tetratricopeptide repeat protein [Chitinispirillaceae bacterium]
MKPKFIVFICVALFITTVYSQSYLQKVHSVKMSRLEAANRMDLNAINMWINQEKPKAFTLFATIYTKDDRVLQGLFKESWVPKPSIFQSDFSVCYVVAINEREKFCPSETDSILVGNQIGRPFDGKWLFPYITGKLSLYSSFSSPAPEYYTYDGGEFRKIVKSEIVDILKQQPQSLCDLDTTHFHTYLLQSVIAFNNSSDLEKISYDVFQKAFRYYKRAKYARRRKSKLKELEKALNIYPNFLAALIMRASIHCDMKNYELSLADIEAAQKINPRANKLNNIKAIYFEDQKVNDSAVYYYNKYLKFAIDSTDAQNYVRKRIRKLKGTVLY